MVQVTLYTKPGCCLCDDARTHLDDLAADVTFELRELDIRDDPALFERYRYRIPVVVVNGHEALEGRIERADLAAALTGPGVA
jgi:glutaredoxin